VVIYPAFYLRARVPLGSLQWLVLAGSWVGAFPGLLLGVMGPWAAVVVTPGWAGKGAGWAGGHVAWWVVCGDSDPGCGRFVSVRYCSYDEA